MSEAHDNTKPAQQGAYNLSRAGLVCYFPIEEAGFLKPSLSLVIIQKSDGEVACLINQAWMPLKGISE